MLLCGELAAGTNTMSVIAAKTVSVTSLVVPCLHVRSGRWQLQPSPLCLLLRSLSSPAQFRVAVYNNEVVDWLHSMFVGSVPACLIRSVSTASTTWSLTVLLVNSHKRIGMATVQHQRHRHGKHHQLPAQVLEPAESGSLSRLDPQTSQRANRASADPAKRGNGRGNGGPIRSFIIRMGSASP